MASSKLEVKLFGGIAVSRGSTTLGARDFGGTKAKQLFQLLVLARGEPMPKDRLADLIWGESLPVHVNATLETYVSVVRRKLSGIVGDGRGLITTEHEAYALPTAGYELDLARFDDLVRQADAAEPTARRRHLEDALTLATGSVLADEPYSDWAIDERWRYERRIVDTAIMASSLAMDERDARSALAHAERAIAVEPLDERGYHAGLLALQALGRDRDAIALYDRCCALIEEAEATPLSDELRELRATIGRRETVNLTARAEAPARTSRGGRRRNAVQVLGRCEELDAVSRAFEATRDGGSELILIEGELGIGKTTLLTAASRELEGVGLGWARCSELVSGIPYAAIALALREVLGTSTIDVRDYPALALVFPEMRVRSTSAAPRTVDALESLVALVEALAPLVLILDDLHWADADTLVALDYLASRGPLRGVTLAGAVRPEETSSGHRVAQLRPTMRIPLGALEEADLDAARDRRPVSPHRGAPALRKPRARARRRGQALALRGGGSPLPRRGRRRVPAPQRSLPARRVVLGLAARSRRGHEDGNRRAGARPPLPSPAALARRRALPLSHAADAPGHGGQPLACLARAARAAHLA